jgi:protein O-mannosyl-transferase
MKLETAHEESFRALPPWLGMAALVLVTIIAYLPAVNAGFIWDDDSYVTDNPHLRDADGLKRIWVPRNTPQYYPMVFTTFWAEYQLWELEPKGYHLVNVLLHAVCAILLWLVMIRLKVPGAWLIAAVFALHPTMVESVAWISERKNVLSLFFYLLAALAYLRFDRMRFGWVDEDAARDRRECWGWYGAAVLLFVLALLSKTVTCSLPAALILVMLWLRVPISAKRLLPLVPMFIIGFALAMLTVVIEREHVGAVGEAFDYGFIERMLIASKALLFYPWKILWPHPLMFIYPRWEIDAANVMQYWSLIACVVIGLVCILAFARGWRGPFVALSFYAGTVFPAIGFFNVYPHIFSFVADHFVYHASIGIIAFVVGGGAYVLRDRAWRAIVALPLLTLLAVLTWNHATVFDNEETLYRDNIAKNPQAWMPLNNLSTQMLRQAEQAMREGDDASVRDRAEEAAEFAQAALDARPGHHTAHANLSEALRLLDDLDGALHHAEAAAGELPHFPHYRWQIGRLHHLHGEFDQAIIRYAEAVELAPGSYRYRYDLIQLLLYQQRFDEASQQLADMLQRFPSDYFALATLGAIHQQEGRDRRALDLLRRAVEIARTEADYVQTLSRLIRLHTFSSDDRVRDLPQARQLVQQLFAITGGDDPGSLAVLASIHAAEGDYDGAIQLIEHAIALAREAGLEEARVQLERERDEYLILRRERERDREAQSEQP